MSLAVNYNFKNLYINNNKFYNLVTKTYSGTLFNKPSINVDGPKKGLKAIAFKASAQQYMTVAPFYTTSNGLSFGFWFKAESSTGTWSRIVDFGNGAGQDNIFICINNGNLCLGVLQSTNSYRNDNVISNVNDNTWRHIVWTLDPSKGWNIYLNGVLKQTYADGFYPKTMMRNYQYIGKSNWAADPYYQGLIADFRVYNTEISQTEINNIFNMSFDTGANKNDMIDDPPLVTGVSQLYNDIFCDLNKENNDFIECVNCNFGEEIITYKTTTENSQEKCRSVCSKEPICTSYSYDFSKKKDNCSQYITFPNERRKGVQNINSGYNVNKFNYKFSDLNESQKKNVSLKCSDQYLNNMFLPSKNVDLLNCINIDNDNIGNFTKIDADPKCIYNLYKSNGLNPGSENRLNYITDPILKISQGDPEIDNYYTTYKSFLGKQVGNSNINNLLNIKDPPDTGDDSIYKINIPPPAEGDRSEIVNTIMETGDAIVTTMDYPYNYNLESFDNQNNIEKYNYTKMIIVGIIFILIIIILIRIFCSSKKK